MAQNGPAAPPTTTTTNSMPPPSTATTRQRLDDLRTGHVSSLSGLASGSSGHPSGAVRTTTTTTTTAQAVGVTLFRAPAHKHAHHLHSIPPREKSTRTLIIDHMLWVHGRTRFAQARAELGMSDRTGGPSDPNYAHRTRPEQYEEDEEYGSDGDEDPLHSLLARAGGPGHDEEDDRRTKQDLALARTLRLRAEGLEKVVGSMLEQPPMVQHARGDEDHHHHHHKVVSTDPHRLPNGVRLRLALGAIINDLFARQAPPPPYRHTQHQHRSRSSSSSSPVASTSPSSTRHSHSSSPSDTPLDLPEALTSLATVSGAFTSPHHPPTHPSCLSHSPSTSTSTSRQYPTPSQRTLDLYAVGADPDTANSPPSLRCPRHLHTGCEICVEAKSPLPHPRRGAPSSPHPHGRDRAGSYGRGSGSGSGSASGPSSSTLNGPRSNAHSHTHASNTILPAGGISGWQDGSGIGSGLLRPGPRGSALRRSRVHGATVMGKGKGVLGGGGPRGRRTGSYQGRDALRDRDRRGSEREFLDSDSSAPSPAGGGADARDGGELRGNGNTKLSLLIPHFVRLSALVAAELGREARGEERDDDDEDEESSEGEDEDEGEGGAEQGNESPRTPRQRSKGPSSSSQDFFSSPRAQHRHPPSHSTLPSASQPAPSTFTSTPTRSTPTAPGFTSSLTPDQIQMYKYAFRPTREWYMLLAGLLTRAVLEGYLTGGWRGVGGVECVLLFGLGVGSGGAMGRGGRRGRGRRRRRHVGEGDDGIVDDGRLGEEEEESRSRSRSQSQERAHDEDMEDVDFVASGDADEGEEDTEGEQEEEFSEFNPDDLPSLVDAVRILFPSLREEGGGKKVGAEDEYEREMLERLRRFYDIPASTPDCSTHMEDLAWQYPAEPVERAALRFCEGIAKWRGKPELETYKKRPPFVSGSSSTSTSTTTPTTANTTPATTAGQVRTHGTSVPQTQTQPYGIGSYPQPRTAYPTTYAPHHHQYHPSFPPPQTSPYGPTTVGYGGYTLPMTMSMYGTPSGNAITLGTLPTASTTTTSGTTGSSGAPASSPSPGAMSLDALVHSNPPTPTLAHSHVRRGSTGRKEREEEEAEKEREKEREKEQKEKEERERERKERRERGKKPSVYVYFVPAPGHGGGGSGRVGTPAFGVSSSGGRSGGDRQQRMASSLGGDRSPTPTPMSVGMALGMGMSSAAAATGRYHPPAPTPSSSSISSSTASTSQPHRQIPTSPSVPRVIAPPPSSGWQSILPASSSSSSSQAYGMTSTPLQHQQLHQHLMQQTAPISPSRQSGNMGGMHPPPPPTAAATAAQQQHYQPHHTSTAAAPTTSHHYPPPQPPPQHHQPQRIAQSHQHQHQQMESASPTSSSSKRTREADDVGGRNEGVKRYHPLDPSNQRGYDRSYGGGSR